MHAAAEHDSVRARELGANIHAGEIAIFDKASLGYAHLVGPAARDVFWGARAKDNLQSRVVRKLQDGATNKILGDDLIVLTDPTQQGCPVQLRPATAMVAVDGKLWELVILTNSVTWRPQTIAGLYRCSREVFFKEIKQMVQLAGFLGHSERAIKWQVCTALIA